MVLICDPPIEEVPPPEGIIIKESGPKVIKFTVDELDDNQQELTHDTVHSIVLDLKVGETWQIIIAQRVGSGHQDLPIHVWLSRDPYGMTIPTVWRNLNVISLLSSPTVIYVAENSVTAPPADPSLLILPPGIYYINIHNRHGASSYYKMIMKVLSDT